MDNVSRNGKCFLVREVELAQLRDTDTGVALADVVCQIVEQKVVINYATIY